MQKSLRRYVCTPQALVTLFIITGICLRLWNLPAFFHFTFDEEVFAFVGKRMFINGHIPLIGGVTPMHVHVAPYFYWLSGLILYVSKLNPLGWGISAALIAGLTMCVLYQLGRQLFNRTVALLGVFFYAFSFYQNIFDRHYWGIVFDGIVSLTVLFSLFKIIRGKEKYIYLLAIALAWGIHADLSVLTLFVLTFFSWIYFKPKIKIHVLLIAGGIFFLSFAPLIVFDLKHNFVNISGINKYIQEIKTRKSASHSLNPIDILFFLPRSVARSIYVFGDTDLAKQYSYCKQYSTTRLGEVPPLAILFVISCFVFLVWKRKTYGNNERIGITLIFILFISTFTGIAIYGFVFNGDLFDHYLATVFPVFLLVVAYVLYTIFKNKRLILCGIAGTFAIANFLALANAHHTYGFADKARAVAWVIDKTKKSDISLDVLGSCFRYNGYRYLFLLYGKEPKKSYVDQNFFWLYDHLPAEKHPEITVVIVNPDWQETPEFYSHYQRYKTGAYDSQYFGRIEVLLVDNKNGEYNGDY